MGEDTAGARRLLDLLHRFTAAVPHELNPWNTTKRQKGQISHEHLAITYEESRLLIILFTLSLPSTWWGLSFVTRFLCTWTNGSLVSSSSSSTSLVVMGHAIWEDSFTTITWRRSRARERGTARERCKIRLKVQSIKYRFDKYYFYSQCPIVSFISLR